ncbi:MAG: ABC transporter ATP-binding protein [Eubacteriales bacterium]|nr:ABC transporter ATP-binding protein [Eubacteriales bacterium]
MRKFVPYLKPYKKAAILAPSLIVLEVICELIIPLLMADIIDIGLNGDGGMPLIWKRGALMLLLSVISLISGVSSARFSSIAGQGFGKELRGSIFDKIQSFSFADIDRFSSASLITRLTNDVSALQMMVMMGLRMLVRAPVMLFTALVVCLTVNARLTLVLLIIVPLMAAAIFTLMRVCSRLFTVFQEKIDALNDTVQENLIAVRVVKAFVRGKYEHKKFQTANDALRDAGLAAVMRVILMNPIMMLAMYGAILGVLWFGGNFVANGTMLSGDLYSFFTYISQVLMSVMMLAFSLLHLTRSGACAKRILEVLEAEPDIADAPGSHERVLPEKQGHVEFRNVTFKYRAGTGDNVLDNISLDIEPGSFVAVIGGTGTGKSTLVNLIPRFYDVTEGCVLVDGLDVREYPIEALRERIGMVLQTNILFSGTVRENLLWGDSEASEEQMIRAAKDAQAYDFIMAMPDGFDTKLEQGGVNVSGGQKQRLCIARAMLRHPSILILDDSTSAVDSDTEARIRESFHRNLKGTTVIIIAQRISSVRHADKIILLDDDHIAGMGTHEELLESSPIYREICMSQQEGGIGDV